MKDTRIQLHTLVFYTVSSLSENTMMNYQWLIFLKDTVFLLKGPNVYQRWNCFASPFMASADWMSSVTAPATRFENTANCCFSSGVGFWRTCIKEIKRVRYYMSCVWYGILLRNFKKAQWVQVKTRINCKSRRQSVSLMKTEKNSFIQYIQNTIWGRQTFSQVTLETEI